MNDDAVDKIVSKLRDISRALWVVSFWLIVISFHLAVLKD